MLKHRLDELEMRRKRLLLRSARLREELREDRLYVFEALSGVDRFVATARSFAKPALLSGVGLLLMKVLSGRRRGRRRGRGAALDDDDGAGKTSSAGFAVRALMMVSAARRMLPLVSLLMTYMRSRRQPPPSPESP